MELYDLLLASYTFTFEESYNVAKNQNQPIFYTNWPVWPALACDTDVPRASFPMNICWNEQLNSFPFVYKYQLEITCKLPENQSALSDYLRKGQSL